MCAKYHKYGDDNSVITKGSKEEGSGTFNIQNHVQFDRTFPDFRQPVEIGSFSLDINRKFENGKRQLKCFVKPPNFDSVQFDLCKGYTTMIRKDESKKEYIDDILQWILQNMEQFAVKSKERVADKMTRQLHTDFVCRRWLLTKLMCTPYEKMEGWLIAVTLHNDTYYLCEMEQKRFQDEERTPMGDEMCCWSWGWKFEQYLTGDSPDCVPDTDSPYNNCEAFCTVVRSRLDSHSLVYSDEVDAVDADSKKGRHYVEFKISRELSQPWQHTNFKRFKLIKWWAQSVLVGIPEIVCGFRDDGGIVHRLESFDTQKIPDIAKDIVNPWKPNVCFNFLEQLLSFIKSSIQTDDHRIVHLLRWSPGEPVRCDYPLSNTEYNFLPDWYTDKCT